MMKQQILKIDHDNAKMMKDLTEMKSLLSSSSTPPVNDILCKSTNVKILSAPSLPTPDNENEKEKEEKEEDNEVRKTYQKYQESHGHLHATMKHVLHPLLYIWAGNVHEGQGCEQCMNKTSQQQAIQSIHPPGNSLHAFVEHPYPKCFNDNRIFALFQMLGHPHMTYWTAPRIMHHISFALHFICITFKNSATSARNARHVMI